MKGVHLFVPMLHRRDAVGEHTLALRDRLATSGLPSQIYTELPDLTTADETRPYLDYESDADAGDVLVYQFATDSVMAGWLAARPQPLVVNYHSFTPSEFFAPWNNAIARLQIGAAQRLAELAPRATLGIADSEFVAAELRAAGFSNITSAKGDGNGLFSPTGRELWHELALGLFVLLVGESAFATWVGRSR